MTRRLLVAAALVAATVLGVATAHADPAGPGPGMCQFLGANYNVWYPCDQYQPWLPFGTGDNPPYGSQLPASVCDQPINAHIVGCA